MAGHRVFPSRTPRNDKKLGYRIDQGAVTEDGKYNLVIQENGAAHGETLALVTVSPEDSTEDVGMRLAELVKANGHTIDDE